MFFFFNRNAVSPNLQLLVSLDTNLNGTQRLSVVNNIFNQNLTYNDSYTLTAIEMIINPATGVPRKIKYLKNNVKFFDFFRKFYTFGTSL